MCSPATCRSCGKKTWSGCGRHVDQVMSRVPKPQQCTCRPSTTAASKPATPQRAGLLARLRRR